MKNNAVIYARYSSSSQDEQTIEVQLKMCREYAIQNKYNIIKEYVDKAQSARTGKRNELQQILRDANNQTFQYLIVYNLDRYFRNAGEALNFEMELKNKGVTLLSTFEPYSDNPFGNFARIISYANAQLSSDMYSEKIKNGLANNASKFLTIGNNVPIGFKANKETKKYEIDEQNAHAVKKIFEMYSKGKLVSEIIVYLNNRGYKTSLDKPFNKNSITRILRNKKYLGTYVFKGQETPDAIPRIISNELFNEVQIILDKNILAPARQRSFTEYLLTTKLFCGYCKEMMTGYSAKKKYNYYGCKGKKQHRCDKGPISKELIEDIVIKETQTFLSDEKNIDKIVKEIEIIAKSEKSKTNISELKKQLKMELKKKENTMMAITECDDSEIRTDLYKMLNTIKEKINSLEIDVIKAEIPYNDLITDKVKFFLKQVQTMSINDIQTRKMLIDTFINEVYLYDDKVIIFFLTQNKTVEIEKDLVEKANSLSLETSGPPLFCHNLK